MPELHHEVRNWELALPEKHRSEGLHHERRLGSAGPRHGAVGSQHVISSWRGVPGQAIRESRLERISHVAVRSATEIRHELKAKSTDSIVARFIQMPRPETPGGRALGYFHVAPGICT